MPDGRRLVDQKRLLETLAPLLSPDASDLTCVYYLHTDGRTEKVEGGPLGAAQRALRELVARHVELAAVLDIAHHYGDEPFEGYDPLPPGDEISVEGRHLWYAWRPGLEWWERLRDDSLVQLAEAPYDLGYRAAAWVYAAFVRHQYPAPTGTQIGIHPNEPPWPN